MSQRLLRPFRSFSLSVGRISVCWTWIFASEDLGTSSPESLGERWYEVPTDGHGKTKGWDDGMIPSLPETNIAASPWKRTIFRGELLVSGRVMGWYWDWIDSCPSHDPLIKTTPNRNKGLWRGYFFSTIVPCLGWCGRIEHLIFVDFCGHFLCEKKLFFIQRTTSQHDFMVQDALYTALLASTKSIWVTHTHTHTIWHTFHKNEAQKVGRV